MNFHYNLSIGTQKEILLANENKTLRPISLLNYKLKIVIKLKNDNHSVILEKKSFMHVFKQRKYKNKFNRLFKSEEALLDFKCR